MRKHLEMILWAAGLALLAQGVAGAAEAADASGMTYRVPVRPRLARFAQFNLRNASWTPDSPQGARLSFDLPSELVGKRPVHVDLAQSGPEAADGTIVLEGPRGASTCVPGADATVCTVKYIHLGSKSYGAGQALSLFKADPWHYFQRLAVALSFRSDPIGIVMIPAVKPATP